jgi:hypothetical protein
MKIPFLDKLLLIYDKYKIYIKSALLILVYIVISFSLYFLAPSIYKNYSVITNIFFTVLGLILTGYLLVKHNTDINLNINKRKIAITILSVVALIIISYGFIYLVTKSSNTSIIFTFLLNLVGIFLVLFGVYLLIEKIPFFDKLKKFIYNTKLTKLLYHFIFYLPCLFNDLIEYISNLDEGSNPTPKYVYYILGFEFLFVLGYFLIPKLVRMFYNKDGNQLLREPKYLKTRYSHGTYEELNGKIEETIDFNYNYGISSWIYLHNQSGSNNSKTNEFVSILNYGSKPDILYNQELNELQIRVKTGINTINTIYKTRKLPLQKWNNIFINYNSGLLDIFINGNLVATHKNDIPYMSLDSLTSGTDQGISGGICNIVYYKEPVSKEKIKWLYDTYKNKELPFI